MSIIVPAYNAADHLQRSLRSALLQTMSDLDIVVVDDASTDGTLEMARRVAARDPRVHVLHNERNRGPAVSRNEAIVAARGSWVALLDAGDSWLPDRLERMLHVADQADVVSDDLYIVRSSLFRPSKCTVSSYLQEQGFAVERFRQVGILDLVRYELALLQPIIRKSFLSEHHLAYDADLRRAEDFQLYFEVLAEGARWLQLPAGYYFYYKDDPATRDHERRNKRALWQDTVASNRALLVHPAATSDPVLTAALERRINKALDQVRFAVARDGVREGRLIDVARWLAGRPSEALLLGKFVMERLYVRVLWRVRRLYRGKLPSVPTHEQTLDGGQVDAER